jgi:PAS domain S-box-containing protein
MKILYVEDNQLDRDLTHRELKKSAPDFIMDTVTTQRDALSALEKKRDYDLVLSDMRLPDGDGLAILTHVRGRGLPLAVVIITGQGDEETAVAALKAGAQDYVVKRDGYRDHLPLILEKALECYREASIRSSHPLRVLYAEPSASDVDLTKRHLTNFAPHISMEVVSNASEVFQRLSDQHSDHPYDAILLDYRLPGMNALETMKELRQVRKSDLPIILITGQGDEEVAVQALKLGATDYVVKNPGYLYKLPYVLENAVHSVQLVSEHKAAIQLKRQNELILNSAGEGIVGLDLAGNHTFVNLAAARMLGYEISEMVGLHSHSLWHHTKIDGSHCHEEACPIYAACKEGVVLHDQEDLFWRKDRTGFPVEFSLMPICEGDRLLGSVLTFRDIAPRKKAEKELQNTLESLRKAVGATIQVMVSAVETRDPYTAGHQVRSANLARAIAVEMGLPQDKIEGIRMSGSIHDIGKLSIPAEILSKPTKLTEIEFSLIKEHARQGYEMLKDVESPWPLAEIVYQHHERMDGSGYPRNLKGEEICVEARILTVADVVEAMASHRPYRPTLGIPAALAEIEKNRGTLYDKTVADACLRLFRENGFQLAGT